MIDNFEQIETLLSFDDPDLFYHLQIIRRGKDHPNLVAANRTIKTYYIDNNEKLSKIKQEIIDLCEYFGARAYINLAPKSYRKCTMQCISDMAIRAKDGDFKKIYKCWNTVVGYVKSSEPHWIVDIDVLIIKIVVKLFIMVMGYYLVLKLWISKTILSTNVSLSMFLIKVLQLYIILRFTHKFQLKTDIIL